LSGGSVVCRAPVDQRIQFGAGRVTERTILVEPAGARVSQVTVSLIDSDAIDPGEEGAAMIESVNRKVHLGEDVLSDVLGVSAVVQDSVEDSKNPGLIALDQLTKGGLIACANPSHQIRFVGSHHGKPLVAAK
jgi:hypothetical protein